MYHFHHKQSLVPRRSVLHLSRAPELRLQERNVKIYHSVELELMLAALLAAVVDAGDDVTSAPRSFDGGFQVVRSSMGE